MKQKYMQVKLQYESGAYELCWINSECAKLNKHVIDEDTKIEARVLEVYSSDELDKDEVDINRRFPLRRATDI